MRTKWYKKIFDHKQIDDVKETFKKKDKILNNNWIGESKHHNWVGQLGELAFEEYLKDMGLERGLHYYHYTRKDEPDDTDFTLISTPNYNIDVKTTGSRSYTIDPSWYVNINADQYEKILRDNKTHVLVFSRFLIGKNTAYVLGWIPVKDMEISGELIREGQTFESGSICLSDLYRMPINRLRPLDRLLFISGIGRKLNEKV